MSDTIHRAWNIVDACARSTNGKSFTELRQECGGLQAAQLSRAIKPLQELDIIQKDQNTGHYLLSEGFLSVARLAVASQNPESLIEPFIRQLSEATSESAAYFSWDGSWLECRLKHEAPNSFHYCSTGYRKHHPSHTFFRVVQAYLNKNVLKKILEHEDEPNFPYEEGYNHIRDHHFLKHSETIRGKITRIASPVFKNGAIIGAVGVTTVQSSLNTKETAFISEQVVKIAKEINASLT